MDGADRIMVSNMGRLKSLRRGERLLKLMVLPSRSGTHLGIMDGRRIVLAKAVLTAFVGPGSGAYTRVHYVDGDYHNCRLDNLRWADDAGYFLPAAMTAALFSDHPDSGPLLAFMAGDLGALDHVWGEMVRCLPAFVGRLARERGRPDIDVDDCVQEALLDGVIKLRQGRGPQADKLRQWLVGAAKMRFLHAARQRREVFVDDVV